MADEELDQILDELKNDESMSTLNEESSAEKLDINDDNVNEYVMQKVGRLVESGIETVEAIQQTIASGFEAEELQAFSGLLASVTKAAETLNKINIQNKKAETAKELKELDMKNRKALSGAHGGGTTNVLVATREEVIEKFLNKNKKAIEADFTEQEEGDNEDE